MPTPTAATHAKRTEPTLGLPYRNAEHTNVRDTWAAARSAQVPPLRACALCKHSQPNDAGLQCQCPDVKLISGLQPVAIVRGPGEPCGPGARHLDIPTWGDA